MCTLNYYNGHLSHLIEFRCICETLKCVRDMSFMNYLTNGSSLAPPFAVSFLGLLKSWNSWNSTFFPIKNLWIIFQAMQFGDEAVLYAKVVLKVITLVPFRKLNWQIQLTQIQNRLTIENGTALKIYSKILHSFSFFSAFRICSYCSRFSATHNKQTQRKKSLQNDLCWMWINLLNLHRRWIRLRFICYLMIWGYLIYVHIRSFAHENRDSRATSNEIHFVWQWQCTNIFWT